MSRITLAPTCHRPLAESAPFAVASARLPGVVSYDVRLGVLETSSIAARIREVSPRIDARARALFTPTKAGRRSRELSISSVEGAP